MGGRSSTLFWVLVLVSVAGIALSLNAVHTLVGVVPRIDYIRMAELAVVGLISSPWSLQLPSGASWRPGMPLMMMSIFIIPPALTVLVPLPSLVVITFLARGRWWKYLETFAHVGLGLYVSAQVYNWLYIELYRFPLGRLAAMIVALLTHLVINRSISAVIVADRTKRSLIMQITMIGRELPWGYMNSYLIVLLAMLDQQYITLDILMATILQIGVRLAVANYNKTEKLRQSLWFDGITNCENRSAWDKLVDAAESQLLLHATVFVLDINNFKGINEDLSHLAGDRILRELTDAIRALLPQRARLFRYGGDEFVGFVPSSLETNLRKHIGGAIRAMNQRPDFSNVHLSISLGVAQSPADGFSIRELFHVADARMYEDKRSRKLSVTGIEVGVPPTVLSLVVATESRDVYTAGHTARVAFYALQLAEKMGLDSANRKSVFRGALVHDVGKIGIPDAILNKPGKLTQEEFDVVKRHPTIGYEMCAKLDFRREELEIIRHHHERWNGTGYPGGLRAQSIPLLARIVAVVDVYDALTSNRSYRDAWSHDEAMAYIQQNQDIMFDVDCVASWSALNEGDKVKLPQWTTIGSLLDLALKGGYPLMPEPV